MAYTLKWKEWVTSLLPSPPWTDTLRGQLRAWIHSGEALAGLDGGASVSIVVL